MIRTFIALLAIASMAFAATPYVVLNDAAYEGYTATPNPNYPADGWRDPTGAPGSNWNNGLAYYAAYTEAWPSFNASFYNLIDVTEFGETTDTAIEQVEVAIMNKSGSDGVVDVAILPDDSGYPDNNNYFDVQQDEAGSWTSGTYPDANWNNITYGTAVALTGSGDEYWLACHTYWPSSFNFYVGMEYNAANGGNALYDAGMTYVQDGFNTMGDLGYSGAFGLKCYSIQTGIETASLGEIKAVYK